MNKWLWMLLIPALLIGFQAVAEDAADTSDTPSSKGVTIVQSGALDPAIRERVVSFVEQNTTIPMHALDPRPAMDGSLAGIGRAMLDDKLPDDLFVVVLARPQEDITSHGVLFPSKGFAVVNTKSLQPENNDSETYARRLEKQTIRSVAMLFGLEPCPNPHCALYNYRNDQQLDAIGRNLCPPCFRKLQNNAEQQGITLVQ